MNSSLGDVKYVIVKFLNSNASEQIDISASDSKTTILSLKH